MPKASEIKKNAAVEYNGSVYFVKDIERSVPQGRAGGSIYRMRMYDVVTGSKLDESFKDGDMLQPGLALLAPGGKQMMIENRGGRPRVRILPGDERLNYRPCVDVTFGSLARSFPGKTLGVILTGMGADGREGCRMMKQSGSQIWSQDEKSSVIYGMPMAVAKAGLSDEVLALDDVAPRLIEGVC